MMVSDDVIQELMAEINQLREEKLLLEQKLAGLSSGESIFTSDYILLSEEPLLIKGVLITEGTWNGDFYPASTLEEMAKIPPTNIPLKVEHGQSEWGDSTVGRLVAWEYSPLLKGILFQAEVEDPKVKELIKERKFPAVSLFSWVEKERVDGKSIIKSAIPLEVSLTARPAVPHAVIALSSKYLNDKGEIKVMPEEVVEEAKESSPEELKEAKPESVEPTSQESDFVELEVKEGDVIVVISKENLKEGMTGVEVEPGIYIFLRRGRPVKYYPYPYYPYYYPYYPNYPYYPYYPYPYPYYPKYPYPEEKKLSAESPSATPPAPAPTPPETTTIQSEIVHALEELKKEIASLKGEIQALRTPPTPPTPPPPPPPMTPGEAIVRAFRR